MATDQSSLASPHAVVCRPSGGTNHLSLEAVQLPPIESHQVLVRNKAVAQNPTDVKSFDTNALGDGAVLGCDFCGRVEKVGSDVTRIKVGDRIAGLIWGGEIKGLGAYSTYTVADEKICFRVPGAMSSESAATLPLALTTAWLALFSSKCLGMDRTKGKENSILIWGGTSSVGLYAVQIAQLFGFTIATTCTNSEAVKKVGLRASHIFNYRSPTVVEDVAKALPDIAYVFDTIGSETSSAQASRAVRHTGGILCTVRPGKLHTEDIESRVRATDVLVWTAFLKEHKYKEHYWPVRTLIQCTLTSH